MPKLCSVSAASADSGSDPSTGTGSPAGNAEGIDRGYPFNVRAPMGSAGCRSMLRDENQLAADMTALALRIRLGRPGERKCLNLDHQLAAFQQLGGLRQGLFRPAVLAAPGHTGPGLCRAEVGDREHLRWLRRECNEILDRRLPGHVEYSVDMVNRHRANAIDEPCSVQHRNRTDLPEIIVIRLAGRRDDRCAAGDRELDDDGAHSTSTAVDE